MKKTFLALGLEFGGIALLVFSLTLAAVYGESVTPDAPYGISAAPTAYDPSNAGTATAY